jgi:hypothetical protein
MMICEYSTKTHARRSTMVVPESTQPWSSDSAHTHTNYIEQLIPVSTARSQRSYLVAIGNRGWAWAWSLPAVEDLHLSPCYLGKRRLSPSSFSIVACGSLHLPRPLVYYSAGRTGDVDAWCLDNDEDDSGGDAGEEGTMDEAVGGNEEGLLGNSDPRVMEGLYQDKTVVSVYRATETLHKRDKEQHHQHHHNHHHKEGGKEQHQEPEEAVAIVTALACHATLPLLAVTHANGLLYLLNVRNDVSGMGGMGGVGGTSLGPPSTARAGCVVVRLSKAVAQIRHEPSREGQVIGSVALAEALTNAEEEQTEEERDVLGEWAKGLDPIVPGR